MKGRVFLIHWNAMEAEEHARALRAKGWRVEMETEDGARAGGRILADLPDAVVVCLTRLPSHGRETAEALRSYRAGRYLPIIFVGGKEKAVAKARSRVPDAVFTTRVELMRVLDELTEGGEA